MHFEPYQPIVASSLGLSATVGKDAGDYAQTLQLAVVLIVQSLKFQKFTGEVEFYSSTSDAEATNCKIGLGFYAHNLPLAATDWPKWQKCSLESIRQECKCWGAVEYLNGQPVCILEHRPKSPFIAVLAEEFSDPIAYWQQFDPLKVGQLTEVAFLELPDRCCLVQKHQLDCIEAVGEEARLLQWLELPAEAKNNTWYLFRNRAHYDAWLEQKKLYAGRDGDYPLATTGWEPFPIDLPENLRRQREIYLNRQKPPKREA
jgi:hypothetical protein